MSVASLGAVTYDGSAQTDVVAIAGHSLTSAGYFALLASKIDEVIVASTGIKASELKTSGALSISTAIPFSNVSVTGTVAFTLADGTIEGQIKEIECTVAASTPLGTLTIATPFTGESSTHVFTAVNQKLSLVWRAAGWKTYNKVRAGVQVAVIGTTVLTGYDMALMYDCQVTATVNSTTTKGLPNGTVPGERCYTGCSVAASTPIGSLDGTFLTVANGAATHLQAIGATTDTVTLEWTGAGWLVVANSGITVA